MTTLSETKTRLMAPGTPFFAVNGATSMAQVSDKPDGPLPQGFVLFTEEEGRPNERATGRVLQRQERDMAVVIVDEHLGDADGGDVADPLEALKDYVHGRLLGWAASDMAEPMTFVRGEMIEAANGCVWFALIYSAPRYLKEKV